MSSEEFGFVSSHLLVKDCAAMKEMGFRRIVDIFATCVINIVNRNKKKPFYWLQFEVKQFVCCALAPLQTQSRSFSLNLKHLNLAFDSHCYASF